MEIATQVWADQAVAVVATTKTTVDARVGVAPASGLVQAAGHTTTGTTELQTGAAAASFASGGEIEAELNAPLTSLPFDVGAAAASQSPAVIFFNGEWLAGHVMRSVVTGLHVRFSADGSRTLIPTREFERIRLLNQHIAHVVDPAGADDPVGPKAVEPDARDAADDLTLSAVELIHDPPIPVTRIRRSRRAQIIAGKYGHVSSVPKPNHSMPTELEKNGTGPCSERSNVRQALVQN